MAPIAKPGNPWFGSAGEMTAIADQLVADVTEEIGLADLLVEPSRLELKSA